MREMHLDTIYRNCWEEYYTPTHIYDSRALNWRLVPWREIIAMKFYIKNSIYNFLPTGQGFQYFVRFRHGGVKYTQGIPEKIHTWVGGWSNGHTAYLQEIDFHDGALLRDYTLADAKCIKHPTLT